MENTFDKESKNRINKYVEKYIPNKVLVIGNGFDLAHGLLTDYRDFLIIMKDPDGFLRHYERKIGKPIPGVYDENNPWNLHLKYAENSDENRIREMISIIKSNPWAQYYAKCNAEIEGWIDFEREMMPVLRMFNSIVSNGSHFLGKGDDACEIVKLDDIGMIRTAQIWTKYIQDARLASGSFQGIYVTVEPDYCDKQYGVLTKKLVRDLIVDLNEFVNAFCIYLTEIAESRHGIDYISLFETMKVSHIINFNYTNTADYYQDSLKNAIIHYVHGSTLNSNAEKMILGVNKVENDAEYLFKEFEKTYQRFCNNTKPTYKEIIEKGNYELIFFGHSLDITDKNILEPLIKGANNSTIYCYTDSNGHSDRNTKIKNLMLLLGDEEAGDLLYKGQIILKE